MTPTAPGLDPSLIGAIASHAARAYPAECCGVLLADGKGALAYVEIPNLAGTAAGAATSGRSARDGYVMDPQALVAALERADTQGGFLAAIVHSHPDVGAYFSAEDRRAALGGSDEPLWPGVDYLVASCRRGAVDDLRRYRWGAASQTFAEQILPLPQAR